MRVIWGASVLRCTWWTWRRFGSCPSVQMFRMFLFKFFILFLSSSFLITVITNLHLYKPHCFLLFFIPIWNEDFKAEMCCPRRSEMTEAKVQRMSLRYATYGARSPAPAIARYTQPETGRLQDHSSKKCSGRVGGLCTPKV